MSIDNYEDGRRETGKREFASMNKMGISKHSILLTIRGKLAMCVCEIHGNSFMHQ